MAGEVAVLVADATPYVTAAVGAYGGAVLAKLRDEAADATVGVGRRLLQRVFGHQAASEPLPAPLAALSADAGDADAPGWCGGRCDRLLRPTPRCLKRLGRYLHPLEVSVTQNVRAGRDAYVSGRDMTINRTSRQDE